MRLSRNQIVGAIVGFAVLLAGSALARESVAQFNSRPIPPNVDVLWQVNVVGEYITLASREGGLVLTANAGNFSIQQIRLNPIGGSDRPGIVLGSDPVFWTSRFDPFGVVYEITAHQPVLHGGQPKTIQVPIAIQLLEQRIEERLIVAEFRNLRVQGTPESQNVDYLFNVALIGTHCPNDVTFFVRSDALNSVSGSTSTSGEFRPIRESVSAGTTQIIRDVRVSLFGPRPNDRQGTFRMALVGRDSKGNLITAQCEVPLNPPWLTNQGGTP